MKKITSILMVVIGLVVIVLGASFQPEATSYDLTEKRSNMRRRTTICNTVRLAETSIRRFTRPPT